jgi:hypothetical protein
VPWLRRLVASLSPRRPGFDSRLLVSRVTLGQVCVQVHRFYPVSIILPFGRTNGQIFGNLHKALFSRKSGSIWLKSTFPFLCSLTSKLRCYFYFKAFIDALKVKFIVCRLISLKTHRKRVRITKTNRLTPFRDAITVYRESYTRRGNILCGQDVEFFYV